MKRRTGREKTTIQRIITLYQQHCPGVLADDTYCQALDTYAGKCLDKYVFGKNRPTCKQCPVHCYQPAKREEMRQIMR